MNKIYSFFKFLEEKKGKRIPFKYKLLYAPEDIKEEDLTVEGSLVLSNTPITSLPSNLTVKGSLDLDGTKITSLPDNLTVEGYLDIASTEITSLPNNLRVGITFFVENTPLSKKYTSKDLTKMITDKGGNVETVRKRIFMSS